MSELLVVRPDYRQGRPCLRGTGITVHNVVAAHLRGDSVEEMCLSNPDLSPSLFHAALAYYFENKAQIEADLAADDAWEAAEAAKYPRGIPPSASRPG